MQELAFGHELPSPTATLVIVRVAIQAYMRTAHVKPRRRAQAFLEELDRILANEDSVMRLFPQRPLNERAMQLTARREAVAWFDAMRPVFAASVPRFDI